MIVDAVVVAAVLVLVGAVWWREFIAPTPRGKEPRAIDRACLHLDTEISAADTTGHELVNVLEADAVIGTVIRVLVELDIRCRQCGRVETVAAELDLFPPFADDLGDDRQ